MNEEEIKSDAKCPFCGKIDAFVREEDHLFFVECDFCGARGSSEMNASRETAIAKALFVWAGVSMRFFGEV